MLEYKPYMKITLPSSALLVAACVLVTEVPVQAYLDPGNATLILQGVVGGIAAALVMLKSRWHRVTTLWRRPDQPAGRDHFAD